MVRSKALHPGVILFLLVLIFPLPASRCYGERLPVAASIFPVADMVKQVGKHHIDVITIIPPGASPHTFSLKPSQVKKISAARVFFVIGAGLESWTQKLISTSEHPDRKVVLSDDVPLIRGVARHHPHDDASPSETGFGNPHIWLDPEIAKDMVDRIVDALSRIDHKNKDDYRQNGEAYKIDLDSLGDTIRTAISGFRTKQYVSFHSAWDYFAQRYGLESVGTIQASPGRQPTPKTLLKIVKQIRKHDIKAVFAEPQLNPKVAEVIARQADARVLMLDPLGGPGLKGRDTYIDLMGYNLGILRNAME